MEELEQQREQLAASIETSVAERFQQDIRMLEDQLQDKSRVIYMCSLHLVFPFSALTLLFGRQEGHPACKNWVLVC